MEISFKINIPRESHTWARVSLQCEVHIINFLSSVVGHVFWSTIAQCSTCKVNTATNFSLILFYHKFLHYYDAPKHLKMKWANPINKKPFHFWRFKDSRRVIYNHIRIYPHYFSLLTRGSQPMLATNIPTKYSILVSHIALMCHY